MCATSCRPTGSRWIPPRRAEAGPRPPALGENGVESGGAMDGSSDNGFDRIRREAARKAAAPLLAPLLVVALLMCHGAAGGLHQAAVELVPSVAHGLPAQLGPVDGHPAEDSPAHVDYAAYLAVFFAALVGTLLRPLFRIVGGQPAATLATPRASFATPLLCRGLAPTAPNLQVFRL